MNRLFSVLGAPFTIPMTAASTAFTRSTTSVLIIREMAESWAIKDTSAAVNEFDIDVVSEVRVDMFNENKVDNELSLLTRDEVAADSEVDMDEMPLDRANVLSEIALERDVSIVEKLFIKV